MTTNNDRQRDESGRYTKEYDPEDFLAAVSNDESTTQEIAEATDAPYQTAYHFLKRLEKRGNITSRKRSDVRFWSLADDD